MNTKSITETCKIVYGKILLPTCLLHTVITFIMMLGSDFDAIRLSSAWLVFLFSLCVAFANRLFVNRRMNILLRATLHFICVTAAFVLFMLYASGSMKNNFSGSMMILVVFVVLYLVIAPIPVYFINKHEKKTEEATEYESIYRH